MRRGWPREEGPKISYKGVIEAGSPVVVTLVLDSGPGQRASVLIGFAPSDGGEPKAEGMVVAPGSKGSLELTPDAKGLMQVRGNLAFGPETGTLRVLASGSLVHEERVAGQALWTFAVAPESR